MRCSRPLVWFTLLLRIGISLLMVYAGAIKLWEVGRFAWDIQAYELLGPKLSVMLAVWLPWLEILGGIGLWLPTVRSGSSWLLMGLMVLFMGVLATTWYRGLDVDCGCFGSGQSNIGGATIWLSMVRNTLMLLGLFWLAWFDANAVGEASVRDICGIDFANSRGSL